MAEEKKLEIGAASARQSIAAIAVSINELEEQVFEFVDTAVKEMSHNQHGHVAGNMTVQDISFMLKNEGIKPKLATELARGAVVRHEDFRWSDKGKKIQDEHEKSLKADFSE